MANISFVARTYALFLSLVGTYQQSAVPSLYGDSELEEKRQADLKWHSRRGAGGIIQSLIVAVIGLAIAFIIAAAIFPVAIDNMVAANTTAWSNSTESLWDQIPLFGVIAIVVAVLGVPLAIIMLR